MTHIIECELKLVLYIIIFKVNTIDVNVIIDYNVNIQR